MLSDHVIPGDKVDLTEVKSEDRITKNGVIERKTYSSRVFDIMSEDEIKVNMPFVDGHIVLLEIGDDYDLCFYSGNGLYQCYARITDRYKSNNMYVLTMELTSPLRKFQRREYYRLNCILNMKCREMPDKEIKELEEIGGNDVRFINTDLTLEDGVIVDISGGGAKFISDRQFEKDSKVLFVFSLNLNGRFTEYSVIGRVILSEMIEGRSGEYKNHIQFINIKDKDREGIIRYIFEEERKIRRKASGIEE
ncbi:MAG: flagellar brake protein [Lachnospiraceae bacterium]|jgi:c-di-GMP-binding flagellar brake protein YcgR|nr:flagellar brake protein [Lachnospiraceae bacterium]